MQLADEHPHLKLISRSGGSYLLPTTLLDDARDFFEERDPQAILTGRDVFGALVYVERSDIVGLIVLEIETLVALQAERDERERRELLSGGH